MSVLTPTFRLGQRAARRLGFDITRRSFYSPIPDVDALPVEDRRSELVGIKLDLEEQLAFLSSLAPYIEEYGRNVSLPPNKLFGSVDAECFYGIIRKDKPRLILEYGAGYSTLVAGAAALANERDGWKTRVVSHDPFPGDVIKQGVPGLAEFRAVGIDESMIGECEALSAGDILFVDTTHTVKAGSDVNIVILEVLPRLASGVLVHFHDIFLPWDYPRYWIERGYYWGEQYLLHAFLCGNRDYSIVMAAHMTAREAPDRLARLVPSFRQGMRPGSFWLRKH